LVTKTSKTNGQSPARSVISISW